ncbi:MAG: RtcB family protein, partial [Deltaproteobacteria bacterium]|nr:RtcB family protein [Deltaproteobacteria bacterium]
KRIIGKIFDILSETLPNQPFARMDTTRLINRNHNHAEFKHGLWIHRKGATQAENGMSGVIPGNMRDGSFIVEGLGNPDSLWSSSHGAGRILGRRKAKQQLSLDQFRETMVGIKAKVVSGTLDESPFAYKDIFQIMDSQEKMVKILHHVKPIINIKA